VKRETRIKNQFMKTIRQGDILLTQIDPKDKPKQARKLPAEQGRVILAHGEVTGHHHSIASAHGALLETDSGERFLEIKTTTPLEHQEHAPHWLQENEVYRVVRQREFAPESPTLSRAVLD
jgi:hypothetical protein